MKSLKLVTLLSMMFMQAAVFAQDTIFICQDKTTAIEFPIGIKKPVNRDGITASMPNDHILALRAIKSGLTQTSLEVVNLEGVVYNFPISYSYGRAGKLTKISGIPKHQDKTVPVQLNTVESISRSMTKDKRFNPVAHDKNGKIKSALGSIASSGNTFFYKIRLSNRSNISYDIDFIRFYVRDLKGAKRTVTQEQELFPVFSYGLENPSIAGKGSGTLVFAIEKFPITGEKALFVEVYEKNGGRHLYLKVKQSDIQNAEIFKLNH